MPLSTPEQVFLRFNVSRESQARLKLYAELLERWQGRIALIGEESFNIFWERHIADALQLLPFVGEGRQTIIDLGSGAGIPGLVLALAHPEYQVVLVESNGKKAAFLREVARQARISVKILQERIESIESEPYRSEKPIVTARALAPLTRLLDLSLPLLDCGRGLFHKGQDAGRELIEATKSWSIHYIRHPSVVDPRGTILEILEVRHRHGEGPGRRGREAAHHHHRKSEGRGWKNYDGDQSRHGSGRRRGDRSHL